jgi:uncharacterized membrane protein
MEGGFPIMAIAYPDFSNLSENGSVSDLLSLPNASYPFFWTWIMAGLFLIITLSLYFRERQLKGVGNILSSMAVSSLAVIMLSLVGTLIGILTITTVLPILVFGIVIIAIWIFS